MTAAEIEYPRPCDPLERAGAGPDALLAGASSGLGAARASGEGRSDHDVEEVVDIVHDRL